MAHKTKAQWDESRQDLDMFLQIGDTVDERNDPIRAAEAAARLLKKSSSLAPKAVEHAVTGHRPALCDGLRDELLSLLHGTRQ